MNSIQARGLCAFGGSLLTVPRELKFHRGAIHARSVRRARDRLLGSRRSPEATLTCAARRCRLEARPAAGRRLTMVSRSPHAAQSRTAT